MTLRATRRHPSPPPVQSEYLLRHRGRADGKLVQVQCISTVTAMMDSVIARIEKAAIIRVIHHEPTFAEMFIAHLLARTIRVEADLVDQLFNSSEKRLARMLMLLANFGKESKPEPIIAKISQETPAEMIGTTRSRVSFFMNKFRELGFIDYNGSGVDAAVCVTMRRITL